MPNPKLTERTGRKVVVGKVNLYIWVLREELFHFWEVRSITDKNNGGVVALCDWRRGTAEQHNVIARFEVPVIKDD